jgi:hypothetical protein
LRASPAVGHSGQRFGQLNGPGTAPCSCLNYVQRNIRPKPDIEVEVDDLKFFSEYMRATLTRSCHSSSAGSHAATDTLARLLAAPEQFDPLIRMLDEEARSHPLDPIRHGCSQASA